MLTPLCKKAAVAQKKHKNDVVCFMFTIKISNFAASKIIHLNTL